MMTTKERWLGALHMQPVDRLPFWPKLDAAYPRAQRSPFSSMSNDEIHGWIGSDRLVWLPSIVRELRKSTSVEITTKGARRVTAFCSPAGNTERVDQFDEESQAWHPVRFPVRSPQDLRIMTEIFDDCTVEIDPQGLQVARDRCQALGQDAVTSQGIGESPLMYWVEWLAGVENAHFMLADNQTSVEELFAAMHRVLLRTTELLIEHSPGDVLNFTENTSTTLVSPSQYRRYWLGHIREYGLACQQAGKPVFLHMCGHLKALLPDLATLPVNAFEAFTSPTVGNTTLLDGRTACPDKCLIGGTNAILWLEPTNVIIEQIASDLSVLPHHRGIAITSAGVMPPGCPPDKIKAVCDWLRDFPVRM